MDTNIVSLKFDEIEIGLEKSFQIEILESMLDTFSELSGDVNTLHMEKKYAISQGFEHRVCHGMLLGSFISRLIGMYLPGKHALYFSQSLNFINPCYPNDNITISGKILDKSDATKIITIKTIIKNQSNKIIVEGIARVKIRDD